MCLAVDGVEKWITAPLSFKCTYSPAPALGSSWGMQPCLTLEGVTGGVLLSSRDSVIFRMKIHSWIMSAESPAQMFSFTAVNRYLIHDKCLEMLCASVTLELSCVRMKTFLIDLLFTRDISQADTHSHGAPLQQSLVCVVLQHLNVALAAALITLPYSYMHNVTRQSHMATGYFLFFVCVIVSYEPEPELEWKKDLRREFAFHQLFHDC